MTAEQWWEVFRARLSAHEGKPVVVNPLMERLFIGVLVEAGHAWAESARKETRKACALTASRFSFKEDRRIHPDIGWDEMSENAKLVAHTTAQQIARAIQDGGE